MLNWELLDRVIAHITDHPETHDQHVWAAQLACGTAHCVAGWAVALGQPDAEFVWHTPAPGWVVAYMVRVPDDDGDLHEESISTVAQYLLGLSDDQADALFLPDITLADIEEMTTTWRTADPTSPAVTP